MGVRAVINDLLSHDGVGLDQQSIPSQTFIKEPGVGFLLAIVGTHFDVDAGTRVAALLEERLKDGAILVGTGAFSVFEFKEGLVVRAGTAWNVARATSLWLVVVVSVLVHL